MKTLKILLAILLLSSCAYKNNKEKTAEYSNQLKKDSFVYQGKYVWDFNLMGKKQVSTHIMYSDKIIYNMTGKVYSTKYTMKKLSYEKKNNKWIGQDEKGIVYVLFFKNKTDTSLSIYKHKCKSKGLKEALEFNTPAPNATDDHGWNTYSKNGNNTKYTLPISGDYINDDNKITINDSFFTFEQKKVDKISFHSGERRWVGKYKNQYLQVFFKELKTQNTIQISSTWSNDLEKLYKTKYNSVTNWKTYAKQQ